MGVSRCALLLYCMRLCHCYRHDNGAGDAFWVDIYHFYKQKREIFSQNILQSHDKAVPLQPLLKKSFDHCNDSYGRLAQLVQSVCLTSRGSGVRIPQRPQGVFPVIPSGVAGIFYAHNSTNIYRKSWVSGQSRVDGHYTMCRQRSHGYDIRGYGLTPTINSR